VGKILENTGPNQMRVGVRNRIRPGDDIEVLCPKGPAFRDKVVSILDKKGFECESANPNSQVLITLSRDYAPNDLLRHAEEMCYTDKNRSRAPKKGLKEPD
jgi:hypothetical protein